MVVLNPIVIGILQLIPAIIFYNVFMRSLPEGIFHSYFYFFAKLILFSLPGFLIIKFRKHKI